MDELPLAILGRIDGMCDDFEMALRAGQTVHIDHFVKDFPEQYAPWLLEWLIALEMEFLWSRPSIDAETKSKAAGIQPPLAESYLGRFPVLSSSHASDCLRRLIATEFRIRQERDDRPTIDAMLARFPREADWLSKELRHILNSLSPVVVKYYEARQLAIEIPLRRLLEIGRQRRKEPVPVQLMSLESYDRLVIAAADETTVGRRHTDCELIACQRVRIRNHSEKSWLGVNSADRIEG